MFFQLAISGLAMGALYSLIALGFVMIWNTAAVVNFAQGEFAMLSMFFLYTLHALWGLDVWMAIALAVAATAALGYLFERGLVRPLVRADPLTVIMMTIGLQIFLSNGAKFVWGTEPKAFPAYLGDGNVRFLGVTASPQSLAVIGVVLVLAVVLHWVAQHTRLGKSLRAIAQDREASALMGIRIERTVAAGFALSAALAAVAGVLMAPLVFVAADVGLPLLIKSFIAAVIGGFGSYPGALIGGLLIGVLDNMVGFYISTDYRDVVLFGVLIVILLLRPQGLFPKHR
ncbi:branched-chain amino acid ABC transporter permease [Castellaniella sp. WN]